MKNRIPQKDDWETPKDFYEELDREFHFDFDPCPLNHKIDNLNLDNDWGQCNFVNPPYSRKLKEAFIKRAYWLWRQKNRTSVLLLPVSTSTKVFHEYIYGKAEIRFIKGRLRFSGMKSSGQFDSMLVIFRGRSERSDEKYAKDKQEVKK